MAFSGRSNSIICLWFNFSRTAP